MTKISYIHGVPVNEYAQRGQQAAAAGQTGYVPFLSLTGGEMRLQLLRQRMLLFSRFYPEATSYSRAVAMIDNALMSGVHRGINFVGAIPDELQQVARIIATASKQTRPAAGGAILGRENIMNGVGEIPLADSQERQRLCRIKALGLNKYEREGALRKCDTLFEIERLYNDYIERLGHHTIYNRISQGYPAIPSRAFTKLILHDAGIEGMANAAEMQKALLSDWVENGVYAKNATIGAGLIGSIQTSFYLSTEPEKQLADYLAWVTAQKQGKIGIEAVVVAAIISAIVAVVGAAFKFLSEMQRLKAYAMSEAKGFGTAAYSAQTTDWPIDPNNPTAGQQQDKLLTYAAMGIGAYLLLNDD